MLSCAEEGVCAGLGDFMFWKILPSISLYLIYIYINTSVYNTINLSRHEWTSMFNETVSRDSSPILGLDSTCSWRVHDALYYKCWTDKHHTYLWHTKCLNLRWPLGHMMYVMYTELLPLAKFFYICIYTGFSMLGGWGPSLFHMKIIASVTESTHQDLGLCYLHLPIFVFYIHSSAAK